MLSVCAIVAAPPVDRSSAETPELRARMAEVDAREAAASIGGHEPVPGHLPGTDPGRREARLLAPVTPVA